MAKKKVSHVFVFPGKTEINQVRFYKIRLANTAKCTTAFIFYELKATLSFEECFPFEYPTSSCSSAT